MPRARVKRLAAIAALAAPLACAAQSELPTLLGAGVRSRPAYDGSDSRQSELIPFVRYYGRRWFARTTQGVLEGGVREELAPLFWVGAQAAFEPGRRKSESPLLEARNEPDLDPGASVGLHVEWDRQFGFLPVNFLIRARQNLDLDRGGQADLRTNVGVYSGYGVLAVLFAQATWGSEDAVLSMYGAPNSGLLFTSLGAAASYTLGRRWLIFASGEQRRLRDEAAESPVTERNSASYYSASLVYRF